MFTSAQEQQEKRFTPGNSQTQLGCKEPARLPHADLYHSWFQWSARPIRRWKVPLDLPGLKHKDKWCYQIKCLLMACRETKRGSFTRSHMCMSIVIFPNEAHLEPVCECLWLILWQPWWVKCVVCVIRYFLKIDFLMSISSSFSVGLLPG